MINELLKENYELLYKVEIKKYMNYETNQLEINLSDFKVFNENKKEINTFYLYGVIYNKKTNNYMKENGKFKFKIELDYLNNSKNILKINNTKLIYKTIHNFDNMYNSLDYEIHFLLIPLDYKFFNVITECEKFFDIFLLEEKININKMQTSAKNMLEKTFISFKFLYYLIPFLVIVILQSSISYYIVSLGGFTWEIINPSFILNSIIYFFTYFFTQISPLILLFYKLYIFSMILLLLTVLVSKLSVIIYFIFLFRKIFKWSFNLIIIPCHKIKKSYLVEDININVNKIHFNDIVKVLSSLFLSTTIFSILILTIFVTIITVKDIVNINQKDTNQIEKNNNIIHTISKQYIYNTSFPELIKTDKGDINILVYSNEYEGYIYNIDEIESVIKKSKNNCDFKDLFDQYFFKNNSNSRNFKDFYLTFLFGNMENVSNSKIKNNEYNYIPRQSQEYLEKMNFFEEKLSK